MARRCLRGLPSTSPSREMPNQPDSKAVGRHVKEHLLTGSLLGWDMRATTAQNGLAQSPKTRLKSTMNLVLPERSRAPSLKPTNYRYSPIDTNFPYLRFSEVRGEFHPGS